MLKGFLIMWLITGEPLYFKIQYEDCHTTFDKLTFTKKTTNPNRIRTFYMGKEVLIYRCFEYAKS